MLSFERQVVTSLVHDLPRELQPPVRAYVDSALGALPEHLRAGVAAESVLLGAWARARRTLRHRPADEVPLDVLEASPIGPVRQYVRLMRSLVLFAEHELAPVSAP
jgi:hypothetical protein